MGLELAVTLVPMGLEGIYSGRFNNTHSQE
jgi:hypothetical protein